MKKPSLKRTARTLQWLGSMKFSFWMAKGPCFKGRNSLLVSGSVYRDQIFQVSRHRLHLHRHTHPESPVRPNLAPWDPRDHPIRTSHGLFGRLDFNLCLFKLTFFRFCFSTISNHHVSSPFGDFLYIFPTSEQTNLSQRDIFKILWWVETIVPTVLGRWKVWRVPKFDITNGWFFWRIGFLKGDRKSPQPEQQLEILGWENSHIWEECVSFCTGTNGYFFWFIVFRYMLMLGKKNCHRFLQQYCWWKKSCTSWFLVNIPLFTRFYTSRVSPGVSGT